MSRQTYCLFGYGKLAQNVLYFRQHCLQIKELLTLFDYFYIVGVESKTEPWGTPNKEERKLSHFNMERTRRCIRT